MHELKRILDANGHVVHIVQEDRTGYVVYKDEAQVIAEPSSVLALMHDPRRQAAKNRTKPQLGARQQAAVRGLR
jgi:hypothetical protein